MPLHNLLEYFQAFELIFPVLAQADVQQDSFRELLFDGMQSVSGQLASYPLRVATSSRPTIFENCGFDGLFSGLPLNRHSERI